MRHFLFNMRLLLCSVLVVMCCSRSIMTSYMTPQTSSYIGHTSQKSKDAAHYLQHFGYMENQGEKLTGTVLSTALKQFQKTWRLEQTGEMNKDTKTLMETPRCGFPDTPGYTHNARSKRYTKHRQGGWPKTDLTYTIVNKSSSLPSVLSNDALRRALSEWSKITPLTFTETSGEADLTIFFVSRDHEDGNGFDGPGHMLAHAFFPFEGGDVHFDNDEYWTVDAVGEGIDLFLVGVHELGHSLGLDHSDVAGSIMYPFYTYRSSWEMHPDDIAGIQELYGSNTEPIITTTVTQPSTGTTTSLDPTSKPGSSTSVFDNGKSTIPDSDTTKSTAVVFDTPTLTNPVPDTPKSTTPVPDTPKSTTPVPDTPKSTTPGPDTPKSTNLFPYTPKSTIPVPHTPKSTTPVPDTPKSATPVLDTSKLTNPVPDTPKLTTTVPNTSKSTTLLPLTATPTTSPNFCVFNHLDAITSDKSGNIFVFHGDTYTLIGHKGIVNGFPRLINTDLPEVTGPVDAVVYLPELVRHHCVTGNGVKRCYVLQRPEEVYLFSGPVYHRYESGYLETRKRKESGLISSEFKGIPSGVTIDAAFTYDGTDIYLISGNSVWKKLRRRTQIETGYPKILSEVVSGLSPPINDVLSLPTTFTYYNYFFSREVYYRTTNSDQNIDSEQYPRSISEAWCTNNATNNMGFLKHHTVHLKKNYERLVVEKNIEL